MYKAKAYSVCRATSPLASTKIPCRDPTEHDVEIEILFSGICHSDLHSVRDEWSEFVPTVYPIVPGHEIVGGVTKVGSAVTKFNPGELAAVGCMVDSDGACPEWRAGFEQFCPNPTLTFTYARQTSRSRYLWRLLREHCRTARGSCCAFSRTCTSPGPRLCSAPESQHTRPMHRFKVGKDKNVGVVGLGGLGHMAVKFAGALGSRVVVFTTSPRKKEDALRLGAHEGVVSRDANEMQKHAGSFDFILDAVSADHVINAYLKLLGRDGNLTLAGAPPKPLGLERRWHRRNPGDARFLRETQHHRRCRSHPDPESQRSL